jgi:hypothetical protein
VFAGPNLYSDRVRNKKKRKEKKLILYLPAPYGGDHN